jgi:limonene-1,2-epoxide hydrolase
VSSAENVVREFCDAWSRRDMDELIGFFKPDAIYHNMPLPPAEGHDAIRGVLQLFVPASQRIEFDILAIASVGDKVLTERVDRFEMGSITMEIPVAGIFEIEDGKIAAWRDYFDMQTWTNQMSGAP